MSGREETQGRGAFSNDENKDKKLRRVYNLTSFQTKASLQKNSQTLSENQDGGIDILQKCLPIMGEHLLREHNRKEDLPNISHQANNYISGVPFPPLLDRHGLERDENIGIYFVRTTEVGIEREIMDGFP